MLSSADASSLPPTTTSTASPSLGSGQLPPNSATSFMGYSSVWSPIMESKNSLSAGSPLMDMKRTQSLGSAASPQYSSPYEIQAMHHHQQPSMQQQQQTHHHHYYYSALDEARQMYNGSSSTLAPSVSSGSSSPGLLLNSSRLPPASANKYYSATPVHHHHEAVGNPSLPAMSMMMNGNPNNGGRRFWTDEYGQDMCMFFFKNIILQKTLK